MSVTDDIMKAVVPDPVSYPPLSEMGQLEAQELIENFKSKLRKVATEVISELYVDIASHIETDAWGNYRNQLWRELSDWKNLHKHHNYKKVRDAIFQEHREELVKDLNQDLLSEIESLKKELEYARDSRFR
jgi:hypothetical protein